MIGSIIRAVAAIDGHAWAAYEAFANMATALALGFAVLAVERLARGGRS